MELPTVGWISKLPTNYRSSIVVPRVITDGAILTTNTDFHSAIQFTASVTLTDQLNWTSNTSFWNLMKKSLEIYQNYLEYFTCTVIYSISSESYVAHTHKCSLCVFTFCILMTYHTFWYTTLINIYKWKGEGVRHNPTINVSWTCLYWCRMTLIVWYKKMAG